MHLSMCRADGAYPAPCLTIASGLAHVCTAGNRRRFLSAAVGASRVAGIRQRMISSVHTRTVASANCVLSGPWGDRMRVPAISPQPANPAPASPVRPGARQSFPTRQKVPASFHAIGSLVFHTDVVRAGEPTRCVIVDDNRDFLDAAARLLENQGISVVAVATSYAEGLRCVEELRPDVTLVDIDLGEESGFDVVEQLHRNGSSVAVPTILISTHAEEDFAEMVAASPAVAFIPKAALSGAAIREVLGLVG